MAQELKAVACPFCGDTPGDNAHTLTDGGCKYGAIQCGCGAIGPDVRTEYKDWPHWKDAAIREWNTRAQPIQGGEAVKVVGYLSHCADGYDPDAPPPQPQEPLMTVAQHQRIMAATHPADQVADDLTMVKVSRELLEQIAAELEHDNDRYFLGRELRALLTSSPK